MVLGSNCTTDIRGITWRGRVWWQGKKLKKRRLGCSRLEHQAPYNDLRKKNNILSMDTVKIVSTYSLLLWAVAQEQRDIIYNT